MFIHERSQPFGILPDRQVSVWVWALHNSLCTPAGATSSCAIWTTKPVENVSFLVTKTTEFDSLLTLLY